MERPHWAAMARHIAQAEKAADCSKPVVVAAAVHHSTTAADSCRLPRCFSSENPFFEFYSIYLL